jgi:seryl-tRNA synthetase
LEATLAQELGEAKQAAAQAKCDLESLQLELQAARANGAESATLAQELSEAKQAAAQAKCDLETLQLSAQSMESSCTSLKQQLEASIQSESETKAKLEQTLQGLPDPNQADVAIGHEQRGLQKEGLNSSHRIS